LLDQHQRHIVKCIESNSGRYGHQTGEAMIPERKRTAGKGKADSRPTIAESTNSS